MYAYAFFSTEFSGEFYVFPGLQKMKQVINITHPADEETLFNTH